MKHASPSASTTGLFAKTPLEIEVERIVMGATRPLSLNRITDQCRLTAHQSRVRGALETLRDRGAVVWLSDGTWESAHRTQAPHDVDLKAVRRKRQNKPRKLETEIEQILKQASRALSLESIARKCKSSTRPHIHAALKNLQAKGKISWLANGNWIRLSVQANQTTDSQKTKTQCPLAK